jgi:hypothetical protein
MQPQQRNTEKTPMMKAHGPARKFQEVDLKTAFAMASMMTPIIVNKDM